MPSKPYNPLGTTLPYWQQASEAIGAIKRILILPCQVSPIVYVETGAEALLNAAASILSPDPKEVYHQIMGKSLVCSLKTEIREAAALTRAEEGFAKRFLFTASEFVDLAVWYLFLFDVAAEGLINWQSQIYKVSGCANRSDPAYGSGTGYVGALNAHGKDQTMDFAFAGSVFAPAAASEVFCHAGNLGLVAGSVSFYYWGGQPCGGKVTTAISCDWLSGPVDQGQGSSDPYPQAARAWAKQRAPKDGPGGWMRQTWNMSDPNAPLGEVFPDHTSMSCSLYTPSF